MKLHRVLLVANALLMVHLIALNVLPGAPQDTPIGEKWWPSPWGADDQRGELLERHLVGTREEGATPSDVPFALLEHALGFGFTRRTDRGAHSPVRPGIVELPRVGTTTLFPNRAHAYPFGPRLR